MRDTSVVSKMIQVRNVSDRLHRELTRRAQQEGRTLTEYVERILEREVARPPASEVMSRIRRRRPVDLEAAASDLLRAERAERGA
jgi:antitoxin FitA